MGSFSFTKWLRIMNINHSFMSTNQKFDIAHYFPMSAWLFLMSRSHKNYPKKVVLVQDSTWNGHVNDLN